MKAVLQRARNAAVTVDGTVTGTISHGMVILLCVENGDTEEDTTFFARKIAHMRIFPDGDGRMNRSILDVGGSVLAVSQFTLAAEWRKGNRPGFSGAAPPDEGQRLYQDFCACMANEGVPVETGVFGAHMDVEFINDGPVTIWMDSREPR